MHYLIALSRLNRGIFAANQNNFSMPSKHLIVLYMWLLRSFPKAMIFICSLFVSQNIWYGKAYSCYVLFLTRTSAEQMP